MTLLLGAVAYDPKVVTIWDGFRPLVAATRTSPFDYVLYSHYERQVEDLRRRSASTSPGTPRWPGCAPAAWPRPGTRLSRWSCATPTAT